MKSDKAWSVSPLSADRDSLDWPFHTGVVDDVVAKIEQKVKRRKIRRHRVVGTVASLTVLMLAILWGLPTLLSTSRVATPAAQRQLLALSDGSEATLNARTNLRTDFRYGRRVVHLDRGEAFFSVAKDAAHPFLVETPAGTVRVVGTKFNVRVLPSEKLEVTLMEGSVRLESNDREEMTLRPGEQWAGDDNRGVVRQLTLVELEGVAAWREGRLALDSLTLGEALSRLASFHGKEISIAPAAEGLRPGGSVPLDDLAAALDALQATLPIQVLPVGDTYRIVGR